MTLNIDFTHGGNLFAVARALGVAPEEILDFSASINPLGMPPGVRSAVVDALDRAMHYPDDGADDLRMALAQRHGVQAGNIVVANGSTELIHLVPRLFPPGRALIVAPPFAEYQRALERCGWQWDYFPLEPSDGFVLNLTALEQRLQSSYRMLFLCNPGNPTGSVLPPDEVIRVAALCRERGTFLVLDEAFIDFCPEAAADGILVRERHAVVLRSLTKFFAFPGLRLGYAVAQEEVAGRLRAQREPWSVNTLAQAAGLAGLSDVEFAQRSVALVREEAAFLFARLHEIVCLSPFPTKANYLLVRIAPDTKMTAAALRDRLLEHRILIRDCANFQGLDQSYFRVAVRTRPENLRLLEALQQVFSAS